jgi:hypothetical protein
MATKNRASRHSLQNQMVGCARPNITQSSKLANGAFQKSPLRPDQEGPASESLHLHIRGTLGQPASHRCPDLDLRKPDVASPAVVEPPWRRSSETRTFAGTGCARCPISRAWPRPPDSIAPPQRCIATIASPASRSAAATTRAGAGAHSQSGPPWLGTHAYHATHTSTHTTRHPAAAISPADR